MTSNSFLRSARNLKPSPMCVFTAGCWKPTDMPGRYCLERRITACVSVSIASGEGIRLSDFVNVAQDGFLYTLVLHDFTEDAAVPTSDDENLLRVRVGVHGEMRDHLLVADQSAVSLRARESGLLRWCGRTRTRPALCIGSRCPAPARCRSRLTRRRGRPGTCSSRCAGSR